MAGRDRGVLSSDEFERAMATVLRRRSRAPLTLPTREES
jgi:hypothetical protein